MSKTKKYKPKRRTSLSLHEGVIEAAKKKVSREGWKSVSAYINNLIEKDNG